MSKMGFVIEKTHDSWDVVKKREEMLFKQTEKDSKKTAVKMLLWVFGAIFCVVRATDNAETYGALKMGNECNKELTKFCDEIFESKN